MYSGQASRATLAGGPRVPKHYVRDWNDEGRVEGKMIFAPILDVLTLTGLPSTSLEHGR